MESSVIQ